MLDSSAHQPATAVSTVPAPSRIELDARADRANLRAAYVDRVRPGLGKVMEALCLDKYFHRGQGNSLYYYDANGHEVGVTDFVGGYGALMFGHNHPALTAVARSIVDRNVPFAAQGSVRGYTARLSETLDEILFETVGRHFICNYANSGAEAVELAMKHAEMSNLGRLQRQVDKAQRKSLAALREAGTTIAFSDEARAFAAEHLTFDDQRVPVRSADQRVPVRSTDQRVPVRSADQRVPVRSADQRVPVRSADQRVPVRSADQRVPVRSADHASQRNRPAESEGCADVLALREFAELVTAFNEQALETAPVFVGLDKGFHGKTTGAVKLTSNPEYRQPFRRIGPNGRFVKIADVEDLASAIEKATVRIYHLELVGEQLTVGHTSHCNIPALFIEPIQGEGGVTIVPDAFLVECRRLCSEHGIHLVFDEIQAGMGRTGTFFASEPSGVRADYYLLSKSLGGGLAKTSVACIDQKLYETEFSIIHSSTFAEDDASSAVALRAVQLLREEPALMANCIERGEQLTAGLREIQSEYPGIIRKITGRGLMIGVHFETFDSCGRDGLRLLSVNGMLGYVMMGYLFHEHRIRVAPLLSPQTILRLEPSALITEDDCQNLLEAMRRLCEVLYKMNIYALTRFMIGLETPGRPAEVEDFRCHLPAYQAPPGANKVAFIGHFIDAKDLPSWDPGYGLFTPEQLERLIERVYRVNPAHLVDQITVHTKDGQAVSLQFIGLSITSKIITEHMRSRDLDPVVKMVEDGVDMAHRLGCTAIGFGGYTSIVTNNCRKIDSPSAGLTTGNSLTAGMGLEAILRACGDRAIDLDEACFAAIGANGNICSVYAELMAERVPRVVLIGRPGRQKALEAVATRIYADALGALRAGGSAKPTGVAKAIQNTAALQDLLTEAPGRDDGERLLRRLTDELGAEAPVQVSTSVEDIRQANVILAASNSATPLIFPDMVRDGPVVICDVALPMDTDDSVLTERPDVTVLQGGVVKLPRNEDFRVRGIPLPLGRAFACMSETLLLGLADIREHFSRGSISKDQVKRILDIAKTHGFELGELKKQRSY